MISLVQRKSIGFSAGVLASPILELRLNDVSNIVFDLSDGESVNQDLLEGADFYFKRSLPLNSPDHPKLRPYGLNYACYGPAMGWQRRILWALLSDKSSLKRNSLLQLARHVTPLARLVGVDKGRRSADYRFFEGQPDAERRPKIIFFTRAWSPDRPGLPTEHVEERRSMNERRAECIRRLRKEFGDLFMGGFEAEDYSIEKFPDCVVEARDVTKKRNYLKNLSSASICISTVGLQGSTPWKLGEYVAGAKAIVSEPVRHRLPGDFEKNRNYLEFKTAGECVEAVGRLVDSPELRAQIMQNNAGYYSNYLRPDKLVMNMLEEAALGTRGSR
jgi:hypothetical protein